MVETIEKLSEDCKNPQNIPVIFIEEDRDEEINNERLVNGFDNYSPSVRVVNINKSPEIPGFGFLLSRSKWDPYPYVSKIDEESPASCSGLKEGDCVLEVNGEDVLGMRIADVANLVKSKDHVNLLLWNINVDQQCESQNILCGPLPTQYEKLAATVQTILTAIECPVCFNTIPSPFIQCQNGHLLCLKCRARSDRCPICRDRYSVVRCLLAEQIYTTLIETFNLQDGPQGKIREKIFGSTAVVKRQQQSIVTPKVNSHTQKFLLKILGGKSSSMETLSQQKEIKKMNSALIRNKVLSQSASNICRPESTQMSITPMNQKLGSELSNSCGSLIGLRRHPRSYNGSSESLPIFPTTSHSQCNVVDESLYLCPSGEDCENEKLKGEQLIHHVHSKHHLPIILFGCSSAEISLPPRMPIERALLVLELDGKRFWVRVNVVGNNDLFISCLMQASFDYTSKYILEIAIRKNANKILGVQLINRNEIYSLQRTSWQEIFTSQHGIKMLDENIRATFADDEINLQVSIKRIEDM